MNKFLFAFLILTTTNYSFSQCVKGKITDSAENSITNATFFDLNHSTGTRSNNEDAAFAIMGKTIAMSFYYRNQIEDYNCKIYLKGSSKAIKNPFILKKSRKKVTIEEGKVHLIEKNIDLHLKLPDIIETKIISMRSSLDVDDVSLMEYMPSFLYHDVENVISPLDQDAFSYYKFQLDTSFCDQDYLIHKIKVIPLFESHNLYSGYIFIVDKLWSLYKIQLQLEQKRSTIKVYSIYKPFSKNTWIPVSHNFEINIRKKRIESEFKYSAFVSEHKIKLNPDLDNSFYDGILKGTKKECDKFSEDIQQEIQCLIHNDKLTRKEFKKLEKLIKKDVKKSIPKKELEIKNYNLIGDSAELRTPNYWNSIRPIPLTPSEIESYKDKDSVLLRMKNDTAFKDSVQQVKSKFKWSKFMMGGNFSFSEGKHQILYSGLIDKVHIDYNTTEGFKYGMEFTYSYYNERGKNYRINYDIDYAFGRKTMTHDIGMKYRYNGIKRGCLYLAGGTVTSDIEGSTGIPRNLNMVTTLFLEEDYLKVFQKDYIEIAHRIDIANGLDFLIDFEYAQRKKIMDYSDFYNYISPDDEFSSNTTTLETVENSPIGDHNASVAEFRIRYTPKYYYTIKKGAKTYSHSNYPTFALHYYKGIKGLFNSNVDFDRLELSISQSKSIRKLGYLNYELKGGSFLNNNKVYFADYKRFGTNRPIVMGTSHGNIFRLIDYSEYSTHINYFETHLKISNDRILLKRLPFLSNTLMNENLYFSTLHTTGNKPYYEIGYGLNKIFKVFNLEVFSGFNGKSYESTGIKLCVPFIDMKGITITDDM